MSTDLALQVEQLTFSYAQLNSAPSKPVLGNVDLNLPRGSRCILVGANGAAGKRLPRSGAKVLGRAVCFDTPVGVIYVETEWAANAVVRSDLKVSHFWDSVGGYRHEDSRDELVEITHVGLDGLVHEVSDREGRRMEIVNGLMAPWEMLLLDELSQHHGYEKSKLATPRSSW
ncbi:hypothetical protein JCM5353_005628 [Sporobolomyces roseus]